VCDGVSEQGVGERRGQGVTVFFKRVLERGEGSVWWYWGTGCWREERALCGGIGEQECWREERALCDGDWEQDVGEKRGEGVMVFGKTVLERGEVSVG